MCVADSPYRLGLISDTHGLLRREAVEALRGSELIIHAGDVGDAKILEELRKLAPVVAVRGNVDTQKWARTLPLTTVAEAGAVLIYVDGVLYINPGSAGPRRFQLPVSVARLNVAQEPWNLEFVDLEAGEK